MEIIESLVIFGLTRQESIVYQLLFQEGELNGYEAAKLSGISRSNAYSALAGLVDKGAAYMLEENTTKYTPVPIAEFCTNKIRKLEKIAAVLTHSMPRRREPTDGYITIRGKQHIFDKTINVLRDTKERVYLSVASELLQVLEAELLELKERNIKVVIITNAPYQMEGIKVYHTEKPMEQLRIIVDSKYAITGDSETCLYSSNNNLVTVLKEALSNEIQLINIKENN